MDDRESASHLSQISTRWSMFWQAHHGASEAVPSAQRILMEPYGAAAQQTAGSIGGKGFNGHGDRAFAGQVGLDA